MKRAVRITLATLCGWLGFLLAMVVFLGLCGCAHPQPVPVPQSFTISWRNPNTVPACGNPLVYPCQLSQTVKGGTLSTTVAISSTSVPVTGAAGTQFQVVINAYDVHGKLVSSKPSTVILP